MLIPRLPPPPQTFWQRNGSAVQFGLLLAGILAAAVAFGFWQARASLDSVHRAERLDQGP
jgi:hypothetical protein